MVQYQSRCEKKVMKEQRRSKRKEWRKNRFSVAEADLKCLLGWENVGKLCRGDIVFSAKDKLRIFDPMKKNR
jgi:hypothetical protein